MANKTTTKKTKTAPAAKASKPTKTVKVTKKAEPKTPAKTKTAPKSKAKTKTSVASAATVQSHTVESKNTNTPTKKFTIRRSYVILFAVILAVAAFLYFFRGLFVAAIVNGQPISRLSVVRESEKQSGKAALNNLVRNALIEQEARKKHVTVSDKEIDAEVKKVEAQLSSQGQKLDDVLQIQGMTREDLRQIIKLDKLVGKLVGQDVKVSDKEVNEFIEQNKEMLPEASSEAEMKKTVADRLKQQKLNDKVQTWLENLQTNSKPVYFVQY